ncbi:MAG: metal-dependent hydrolase, partial [Firmicutes bacterium]|nr:metal-dependent hydrolase [Bacillota bacterium]
MLARTHFLAGTAAGVLTGVPANVIAAGLSALLPDVDCARSWAGRRAPVVSWGAELLFGHRGLSHSLPAALAASWFVPALLGHLGFHVSREAV